MRTKSSRNSRPRKVSRGEEESIEFSASEKISKTKHAYEIRLKDHLDQQWANWFDGWIITNIGDNEVTLTCSATDHAGLHGVLDKIRDLNLTLISVKRVNVDPPEP